MVGIYKITNKINQKIYIGQSVNISKRWMAHRNGAFNPNNGQYNTPLYKAIRKYGIENFTFEILEECAINELNIKEKQYIQLLDATNSDIGYNLTQGGQNSHCVNSKISEDALQKIVNLLKNSSLPETEIAKQFNVSQRTISAINLGQIKILSTEIYPLRNSNYLTKLKFNTLNQEKICSICGTPIKTNSLYCIKCAKIVQRKVDRPTRENLKNEIRNQSFLSLGKKYGVSDNAIRKWCQYYNLPTKKSEIKNISNEDWLTI